MAMRLHRPRLIRMVSRRTCVPWATFDRMERDLTLLELMRWADWLHHVQLKLLARQKRVAIAGLTSFRTGEGNARWVMGSLCAWADCARIVLELSPSGQWGSNVERLTRFYESLGFEENSEAGGSFQFREDMIRYPVDCKRHR